MRGRPSGRPPAEAERHPHGFNASRPRAGEEGASAALLAPPGRPIAVWNGFRRARGCPRTGGVVMPVQQFSLVVDREPGRGRRVVVGGPARWDRSPDGAPRVSFDREAPSLLDAVTAAIADVEATGLRVVRVDDSDWVTLADIAARIGRSREIVRLWAL